jgi:PAS domain S-box-containing protein
LQIVKLAAIILDREGRVLFANEYLLSVTGYTAAEVVGQDWYDMFVSSDLRPVRRQNYLDAVHKGDIGVYHESVILTKTGGTRQINWANSLLRGSEGEVVGCASLGYDLTDQRRLEEQFQQAQRLESVGRLAGGVAHDFNNLLTVINGYSALLLRQPLQESMRQQIALIQRAGERGAALTRQLLAFSRRQVIDPKPTNLNPIVRDVVELLARTMGDDIRVETILADGLHAVLVDQESFHQVLVNLAINARDAMPQGGRLTMATANAMLDREGVKGHPEVAAGEYVVLTVSDSGMGMDEKTAQRVFEPFFTTKPAGKGTGLGLASVHGIVQQSRGWIWVESEPGKGATFRIYLPKFDAPEATELPREAVVAEAALHATVLVVDDQDDVRLLAARVLRGEGLVVLEASNGPAALPVAAGHEGEIDLLLTDVEMPEMNGRLLSEELARVRPKMRTLYTSGYTEDVILMRGVLKPGVSYLPKPFSPDALVRKVREMLSS